MMNWYHKEAAQYHPVEHIAMLHAIFVGIHPFIDGQGGIGRLIKE